jgi:hypothetical protein
VAGGRFSIADVPVGDYAVYVTATNGAMAQAQVNVTAGIISRLTLELGATGHIDGTVTDWRTGAPIAGVFCSWHGDGGGGAMSEESDKSGTFAFDVPARKVSIDCYTAGTSSRQAFHTKEVSVAVAPGGSERVVLQLVVTRNPIRPETIDVDIAGDPLRVQRVGPSAQAAGLVVGDLVVMVNGDRVEGLGERAIWPLLLDHAPGDPARIAVERDGAPVTVEVPVLSTGASR